MLSLEMRLDDDWGRGPRKLRITGPGASPTVSRLNPTQARVRELLMQGST